MADEQIQKLSIDVEAQLKTEGFDDGIKRTKAFNNALNETSESSSKAGKKFEDLFGFLSDRARLVGESLGNVFSKSEIQLAKSRADINEKFNQDFKPDTKLGLAHGEWAESVEDLVDTLSSLGSAQRNALAGYAEKMADIREKTEATLKATQALQQAQIDKWQNDFYKKNGNGFDAAIAERERQSKEFSQALKEKMTNDVRLEKEQQKLDKIRDSFYQKNGNGIDNLIAERERQSKEFSNALKEQMQSEVIKEKEVATASRSASTELLGLAKSQERVASASSKSTGRLNKFTKAIGRIVLYRAIRRVMTDIYNSMKEGLDIAYQYSRVMKDLDKMGISESMDRMSSSLLSLKVNLGGGLASVLVTLEPLITSVLNGVNDLAVGINKAIAAFGNGTYIKANSEYLAEYTKNAKAAKGALQGFDELNTININHLDYSKAFEEITMSAEEMEAEKKKVIGLGVAFGGLTTAVKILTEQFGDKNKKLKDQTDYTDKDGNSASRLTSVFTGLAKTVGLVGSAIGLATLLFKENSDAVEQSGNTLKDYEKTYKEVMDEVNGYNSNANSNSNTTPDSSNDVFNQLIKNPNGKFDLNTQFTMPSSYYYDSFLKKEEESKPTYNSAPFTMPSAYYYNSFLKKQEELKLDSGFGIDKAVWGSAFMVAIDEAVKKGLYGGNFSLGSGASAGASAGASSGAEVISIVDLLKSAGSKAAQFLVIPGIERTKQLIRQFQESIGIGSPNVQAKNNVLNENALKIASSYATPVFNGMGINNEGEIATIRDTIYEVANDIVSEIRDNPTKVVLEGDAKQIFRVVRNEAQNYTLSTGRMAF